MLIIALTVDAMKPATLGFVMRVMLVLFIAMTTLTLSAFVVMSATGNRLWHDRHQLQTGRNSQRGAPA